MNYTKQRKQEMKGYLESRNIKKYLELVSEMPVKKRVVYLRELNSVLKENDKKEDQADITLVQKINRIANNLDLPEMVKLQELERTVSEMVSAEDIEVIRAEITNTLAELKKEMGVFREGNEDNSNEINKLIERVSKLQDLASELPTIRTELKDQINDISLKLKDLRIDNSKTIELNDTQSVRLKDDILNIKQRLAKLDNELGKKDLKKVEIRAGENIEVDREELTSKTIYTISSTKKSDTVHIFNSRGSGTGNGDGGSGTASGVLITFDQVAHGFDKLDAIRHDGTSWSKALADDADTLGLYVVIEKVSDDQFKAAMLGRFEVTGHGLTPGEYYFLSDVTAGLLQITEPTFASNPLVFVESADIIHVLPFRPFLLGSGSGFDGVYARKDLGNQPFQLDQNASSTLEVKNETSDTLATSQIKLSAGVAGTIQGIIGAVSPGYTGGGSFTHLASRMSISSSGSATGIDLLVPSGSGDLRIYTGGAGTANERLRVKSDGNIGINEVDPAATLHISTATAGKNILLLKTTDDDDAEFAIKLVDSDDDITFGVTTKNSALSSDPNSSSAIFLENPTNNSAVSFSIRNNTDGGDQLLLRGNDTATGGGSRYCVITTKPVGTPTLGSGFSTFVTDGSADNVNWLARTSSFGKEGVIGVHSNVDYFSINADHVAIERVALWKTSTGQMAIGEALTTDPIAQFDINISSASRPGLYIKLASAQTENILTVETSSLADKLLISNEGEISIFPDRDINTATKNVVGIEIDMDLTGTGAAASGLNHYGFFSDITDVSSTTGNRVIIGGLSRVTIDNDDFNANSTFIGFDAQMRMNPGADTANANSMTALRARIVINDAEGTYPGTVGVLSEVSNNDSLAAISNHKCFVASEPVSGAGATYATYRGLEVAFNTFPDTVTNLIGIEVLGVTAGGTLNRAIRTGAGIVEFGDDVMFDSIVSILADQTTDVAPSDDTTRKKLTLQKLSSAPTNAAYIAFTNNPGSDTFYLVLEEG